MKAKLITKTVDPHFTHSIFSENWIEFDLISLFQKNKKEILFITHLSVS